MNAKTRGNKTAVNVKYKVDNLYGSTLYLVQKTVMCRVGGGGVVPQACIKF